jgi:phenylacetic acid degradation operon negative regulatory protein
MKLRVGERLLLGLYLASAMKAYPSAKLFCWTPVNYSRKKYRQLVGRLQRCQWLQSTVIAGAVHFRLTALAQKRLFTSFPTLTLGGKSWDGFWRLAVFEVPESRRSERDRLRRRLIRFGCGRFQDSLYLTPFDWEPAVLGKMVVLIEAKQKNLGNPQALAARIWPLDQIAKQYRQVIDRLTTRFGIKDKLKRDQFFKRVNQDYLEAFLADPLLPSELLPPDWPAQKAQAFIRRAGVAEG